MAQLYHMILYPTETLYALGVNGFADNEIQQLVNLKGRGSDKYTSVLVRDIADIEQWAVLSDTARLVAEQFLPGSITLVLPVHDGLNGAILPLDRTLGFRISPDHTAQQVIADFMAEHNAPLTCTSANVSGLPPQSTVPEILEQFGERASEIGTVVDDGPRSGAPSTVVRVVREEIIVHREGAIAEADIRAVVNYPDAGHEGIGYA